MKSSTIFIARIVLPLVRRSCMKLRESNRLTMYPVDDQEEAVGKLKRLLKVDRFAEVLGSGLQSSQRASLTRPPLS